MNEVFTALAAVVPVAGWSLHTAILHRRIERARRDPLTGLPGREVFQRIALKMTRQPDAVVVLVDLDRFKELNDTYGHSAGDCALATSAARLAGWADQRGGHAGRLGGDEFAAVIRCPDDLVAALRGLHRSLCRPVSYCGYALQVRASIGAYFAEALPAVPLERALRRADEAMYEAKRAGGGWRIAETPTPVMTSTNGRRTGRPGAAFPGGSR